jgi:hypothetical protein
LVVDATGLAIAFLAAGAFATTGLFATGLAAAGALLSAGFLTASTTAGVVFFAVAMNTPPIGNN